MGKIDSESWKGKNLTFKLNVDKRLPDDEVS